MLLILIYSHLFRTFYCQCIFFDQPHLVSPLSPFVFVTFFKNDKIINYLPYVLRKKNQQTHNGCAFNTFEFSRTHFLNIVYHNGYSEDTWISISLSLVLFHLPSPPSVFLELHFELLRS